MPAKLRSDAVNNTDITPILNTKHRETIKNLIDKYKTEKTREIELKMIILLKNDEPV